MSEETLPRLTSRAAHDMKACLRRIVAYTDIVQHDIAQGETTQVQEHLSVVMRNALRARALVESIRQLTRAREATLSIEGVELDKIVDAAVRELGAEAVGLTLTRDSLPGVRGDATWLTVLFVETLRNVCRYGGKAVHIGMDTHSSTLYVSDDGQGVDHADPSRAVEPFVRMVRHDDTDGSGLGLTICRAIVERHGSALTVTSKRGGGTRVSFALPLRPEDAIPGEQTP